jgi:hypothetical protein
MLKGGDKTALQENNSFKFKRLKGSRENIVSDYVYKCILAHNL